MGSVRASVPYLDGMNRAVALEMHRLEEIDTIDAKSIADRNARIGAASPKRPRPGNRVRRGSSPHGHLVAPQVRICAAIEEGTGLEPVAQRETRAASSRSHASFWAMPRVARASPGTASKSSSGELSLQV